MTRRPLNGVALPPGPAFGWRGCLAAAFGPETPIAHVSARLGPTVTTVSNAATCARPTVASKMLLSRM